jgi:hypothetical protein
MPIISIFIFIQIAAIIILFILVTYALWLAVKALRIYIRKNS